MLNVRSLYDQGVHSFLVPRIYAFDFFASCDLIQNFPFIFLQIVGQLIIKRLANVFSVIFEDSESIFFGI